TPLRRVVGRPLYPATTSLRSCACRTRGDAPAPRGLCGPEEAALFDSAPFDRPPVSPLSHFGRRLAGRPRRHPPRVPSAALQVPIATYCPPVPLPLFAGQVLASVTSSVVPCLPLFAGRVLAASESDSSAASSPSFSCIFPGEHCFLSFPASAIYFCCDFLLHSVALLLQSVSLGSLSFLRDYLVQCVCRTWFPCILDASVLHFSSFSVLLSMYTERHGCPLFFPPFVPSASF
ncbi:hypothetical protein EJB05_55041, partial [Eragrostis curvula]